MACAFHFDCPDTFRPFGIHPFQVRIDDPIGFSDHIPNGLCLPCGFCDDGVKGAIGALSKFETTPLLTVEETLDALRRAQTVGYQPPGKQ